MSAEDKDKYDQLTAIVKDKVIKVEAVNIGKLKPGQVLSKVHKRTNVTLNHTDHKHLLCIFKIRPYSEFGGITDPFDTNTKYCHYDEAHQDYLYQDEWINFLVKLIQDQKLKKDDWKENFRLKQTLNIGEYE